MSTYGRVKDSKTQADEHVDIKGVGAKRSLLSGYDGTNINDSYVDSDGNLRVDHVNMSQLGVLNNILKELKIQNYHLSKLTDECIKYDDL